MRRGTAIVLFGATGDLAQRMLYPALYALDADGRLAPDVAIVGVSRTAMTGDAFADIVEKAARGREDFTPDAWARFRGRLRYLNGDLLASDIYDRLAGDLDGAEDAIFFLSTSPALYEPIVENLARVGLNGAHHRVMVEKPLGRDLASCREINDILARSFDEDRTFRVDHYLGKEAVQNLLALRFANTFFEPLWNRVSIDHVQITVAETVGVEGRLGYYDDYGAIRDMVQNHLLQLLCLVAMEPPASIDADSVRNEKVKVLKSLRPITARDVQRVTVRGRYADLPDSDTETFVALRAEIDNWRWAGVPFYLRTGKRLPVKSSEIVVQFRDTPHSIFATTGLPANRLTIRLQPREEISLTLMNKVPTLEGVNLAPMTLNLSLSDAFPARRRIAYERLFAEALKGDPTLFVRRDEAEAAWAWIDAIIAGWAEIGMRPAAYAPGAWGPFAAQSLIDRDERAWSEALS